MGRKSRKEELKGKERRERGREDGGTMGGRKGVEERCGGSGREGEEKRN